MTTIVIILLVIAYIVWLASEFRRAKDEDEVNED